MTANIVSNLSGQCAPEFALICNELTVLTKNSDIPAILITDSKSATVIRIHKKTR